MQCQSRDYFLPRSIDPSLPLQSSIKWRRGKLPRRLPPFQISLRRRPRRPTLRASMLRGKRSVIFISASWQNRPTDAALPLASPNLMNPTDRRRRAATGNRQCIDDRHGQQEESARRRGGGGVLQALVLHVGYPTLGRSLGRRRCLAPSSGLGACNTSPGGGGGAGGRTGARSVGGMFPRRPPTGGRTRARYPRFLNTNAARPTPALIP